jgi:hypothetical protein
VVWCETGVHTWSVDSIDGFLDYTHLLWALSKALKHNLPPNERRKLDRGLGDAMVQNTRERMISNLLEDGFLYAECPNCRHKRTAEYYKKRGEDVVFVGEAVVPRKFYEKNKAWIEAHRGAFELMKMERA